MSVMLPCADLFGWWRAMWRRNNWFCCIKEPVICSENNFPEDKTGVSCTRQEWLTPPPRKLTCQRKITMINRRYIFKYLGFHPLMFVSFGISTWHIAISSRWFHFCLFPPLLGEMIQFDYHIFSNGLVQPPTRQSLQSLLRYSIPTNHRNHTWILRGHVTKLLVAAHGTSRGENVGLPQLCGLGHFSPPHCTAGGRFV